MSIWNKCEFHSDCFVLNVTTLIDASKNDYRRDVCCLIITLLLVVLLVVVDVVVKVVVVIVIVVFVVFVAKIYIITLITVVADDLSNFHFFMVKDEKTQIPNMIHQPLMAFTPLMRIRGDYNFDRYPLSMVSVTCLNI